MALAVGSGIIGAVLATVGVLLFTGDDTPFETVPVTVVDRVETRVLQPSESGSTAAAVASAVLPSIVTVEIDQSSSGPFQANGSGSGVLLSDEGTLVTNHHVIDGSNRVRVVFANGRTYDATIVGSDALTDLAVLNIVATGLDPIEIGSSDSLGIGDTAIAIGSPLGLEGGPSVTVGVVSAFNRRVRTAPSQELFGMLQTDAPITRGSSGGALVDRNGRLIGITTAIGVSDVGAEGLGFAIPVELMTRVTGELIEFGEASHPFLGITGTTYFEEEPDGATIPAGVVVTEIIDGSAASLSGLFPGDVIRSFHDEPVTTMEQLIVGIRFYRVGDSVDVAVLRGADIIDLSVTLLDRPEDV